IAGDEWGELLPTEAGLDRWRGTVAPLGTGRHELVVVGWIDHVGTWFDGTRRKVLDGQAVSSELAEGSLLLRAAARDAAAGIGARPRTPSWGSGDAPVDPADTAARLEAAAARLDAGDTTLVTDRTEADEV